MEPLKKLDGVVYRPKQEGKAASAVKKKNTCLLRHFRTSTRWVFIVVERKRILAMFMPHTWRGETKLEEHNKTLNEVDENDQDIKQTLFLSGIVAGMNARVEVKPHQELFVVVAARDCTEEIGNEKLGTRKNV